MNTIIHMRTFTFTIPQMHTPMHIHCLTYDASEERERQNHEGPPESY